MAPTEPFLIQGECVDVNNNTIHSAAHDRPSGLLKEDAYDHDTGQRELGVAGGVGRLLPWLSWA